MIMYYFVVNLFYELYRCNESEKKSLLITLKLFIISNNTVIYCKWHILEDKISLIPHGTYYIFKYDLVL